MRVHDMWVRLTIDTNLNVVDAVAVSDAVPYPGGCETIGPAYARLIGLNLMDGFRKKVRERLGGVHGCTHISAMLGFFLTAAIQTFAGERREQPDDGRKPFQIDQCHALDSGSETVRRMYPKWYVNKNAKKSENVGG